MASLLKVCMKCSLAKIFVKDLKAVKTALKKGEDVNSTDEDMKTGLMWTMINQNNSIARLLLEQPTVDLNCIDNRGMTALHHAAMIDNVEGVQLLLADPRLTTPNLKDKLGFTPLMAAMRNNRMNALRELVAHSSIDIDTRNERGESLDDMVR